MVEFITSAQEGFVGIQRLAAALDPDDVSTTMEELVQALGNQHVLPENDTMALPENNTQIESSA